MFRLNPNPLIIDLPNFMLSYYLLVYILGVVVVALVLLRNKEKIKLSENEVYDLVVFAFLMTVAGARIFHVLFWMPNYYFQDPVKILYVWRGGLSFHGGLLGAFVAGLIYSRVKKISLLKLADIVIVPLTFFLALGRLANFMNSEILGIAANVPWCVVFEKVDNVCRHPIQIYAAAGRFALFGILVYIQKKYKGRREGLLIWSFVFLISLGRFFLDFLRDEPVLFGLLVGQWFSLVLIIASIVAFKKMNFFSRKD